MPGSPGEPGKDVSTSGGRGGALRDGSAPETRTLRGAELLSDALWGDLRELLKLLTPRSLSLLRRPVLTFALCSVSSSPPNPGPISFPSRKHAEPTLSGVLSLLLPKTWPGCFSGNM